MRLVADLAVSVRCSCGGMACVVAGGVMLGMVSAVVTVSSFYSYANFMECSKFPQIVSLFLRP